MRSISHRVITEYTENAQAEVEIQMRNREFSVNDLKPKTQHRTLGSAAHRGYNTRHHRNGRFEAKLAVKSGTQASLGLEAKFRVSKVFGNAQAFFWKVFHYF